MIQMNIYLHVTKLFKVTVEDSDDCVDKKVTQSYDTINLQDQE